MAKLGRFTLAGRLADCSGLVGQLPIECRPLDPELALAAANLLERDLANGKSQHEQ